MNHNVTAGRYARLCCSRIVFRTRIRNVQRSMKGTVRLVKIDGVNSFRRAAISFVFFRPHRREAERNTILLQFPTGGKQKLTAALLSRPGILSAFGGLFPAGFCRC